MNYWAFKIADQSRYDDEYGTKYSYDNSHSTRVAAGDEFLYLGSQQKGQHFYGAGRVKKVSERKPKPGEESERIHTIYIAELCDVILFDPCIIFDRSVEGLANRSRLGIKDLLGHANSIRNITGLFFESVLSLAEFKDCFPRESKDRQKASHRIEDKIGTARVRAGLKTFKDEVKERSNHRCVVCGTDLTEVLDVAHLHSYSVDKDNRANPANGICLCSFCHRAMDGCLIAVKPDGNLLVADSVHDQVALSHFNRLQSTERKQMLVGVEAEFLETTIEQFRNVKAAN